MTYHRAALFSCFHLMLVNHVAALECTHPKIITEMAHMDVALGSGNEAGNMLLWDGNDLCDGTSADGCASIGKAYGTCITLSDHNLADDPNAPLPNRDCVASLVFPDGSTLVTRGIISAGDANYVVLGGTGCYHGAQGYAKVTYNEEEKSYTYDLDTVDVNLDEDETDEGGPLSEKSGGRGLRQE
jgi:hypothetical protein